MSEDRLTREERVRLEAFNQISVRHVSRPIDFSVHCQEADQLIAWLQMMNPRGSSRATPLEIRVAPVVEKRTETVTVETAHEDQ
jgi:hypothetical protein